MPDGGRTYDVVIACAGLQEDARLVNNKNYPEIADDFARSIKTYKTLPADVFLGAHSWFFDLAGKYKRLGSTPNPYLDAGGIQGLGREHGEELQHLDRRAEEEPARQLTPISSSSSPSPRSREASPPSPASASAVC